MTTNQSAASGTLNEYVGIFIPGKNTVRAIKVIRAATDGSMTQDEEAILALHDALTAANERADMAWANTQIVENARQKLMAERDTLRAELEALKHDIERYVAIDSEHLAELANYKERSGMAEATLAKRTEELEASIAAFKNARFGVIENGIFRELALDQDVVGARWMGGHHDYELLCAALAAQPERKEEK